jgi:ABC-2 type transport system ATP-binding protein
MNAIELRDLTKRYDHSIGAETRALDGVTLAVPRQSIVGLIGRNGSGKSTLLRHVTGLLLPTSGECMTLGRPAPQLGRAELARIGVVDQQAGFVEWMKTGQLVRYVSTFYERWDRGLERELMDLLDVSESARVGALSPGNVQRLALVLATCHHPELLLLDEPLSDLDPIARQTVLGLLLDRFSSDDITIVISSHMLRDIEPVVNRIVCLHEGRVVADADSDALTERYAEWVVTSPGGRLPAVYREPYVLAARGDGHRARLFVLDAAADVAVFESTHAAHVEVRPLTLEQIFPLLTGHTTAGLAAAQTAPAAQADRAGEGAVS